MGFPLSEYRKGIFSPFLQKIKYLYASMDASYSHAADFYGFRCKGCAENCCEERFYHYTLSEHLYLCDGFSSLDGLTAGRILARAADAAGRQRLHDQQGIHERIMCPLNSEGLCIIYEYRPMICRIQGIPHKMKKPGREEEAGPGCHKFTEEISTKNLPDSGFNLTEFYTEMAGIEIELRRKLNFGLRYKKTIAEMVVDLAAAMDKSV